MLDCFSVILSRAVIGALLAVGASSVTAHDDAAEDAANDALWARRLEKGGDALR